LGTPRSAVLTILDAESSVGFSAPAYMVNEGGMATITVVRGGPLAGTVTVPFAAIDGTATVPGDYAPKQGTLTFAPGVASQTFAMTTVKRLGDNGSRSLVLTLGPPSPGAVTVLGGGSATLTIN